MEIKLWEMMVKLTEQYAAAEGLYLLAALAGMTDVDAVTLSMTDYARRLPDAMAVAGAGVIIAALSNTVVKCILVFTLGSRVLANKLFIATLLIVTAGVITLFVR